MKLSKPILFFTIIILIIISVKDIFPQSTGMISGYIKDNKTDEALPFVNVQLKETRYGAAADEGGYYLITSVPPGNYTIVITAVGYEKLEDNIVIEEDESVRRNFQLNSASIEVGKVYIYGASLRDERITEAPASVSVIDMEEIKRNAGHSQLAKILGNEPGIDIVQSGLFDININARGFNSSLSRRLLVLLDGRDLGTAFLGATEWNGLSIPLEDLGRIELIRGPGSALYGANAFNGVINISSIPPRKYPGTRISLGVGEMNALRADIKNSGVSGNFSYRINAGGYQGDSFSKSRKNRNFEYEGLNPVLNNEVIDINTGPVRSIYGSARIDYIFQDASIATIEGGFTQVKNEVIVTGIGRVQVQKANRPWGRINYNGYGFNILAWTNGRYNVLPEKSLATGLDLIQDAQITHGEVQYNFSALENKLFVVAGVSHRIININTKKTLMLEERDDNSSAIFTQAEYSFTNEIKAVLAARWDRSTLHESRISPKAALVWNFLHGHSLRATYNQAFQPANYSEQYLYVKRPPNPGASSSILYIGNASLIPEEIAGYEFGYKGVFANQLFITTDFYFNRLEQFITDLGPSGTNYFDIEDQVTYAIWSYNNAGIVNEYGVELGAKYYLNDLWNLNANFTLFQFDILEKGTNDLLLPNTPEYKINSGITYNHSSGHSAEINFKYIPSYPWAAGIFRDANIPAYTVVNLSGIYLASSYLSFNLVINNLLDKKHFEILGGSILGRRAIITAVLTL